MCQVQELSLHVTFCSQPLEASVWGLRRYCICITVAEWIVNELLTLTKNVYQVQSSTHGMKCRVTADEQLHKLLRVRDNFLTVYWPKVCVNRYYSSTDRLEYVCAGQDPLGLRLGVTQRAESSPNGVYPWSASHFLCRWQSCEWHQSSRFNETNSVFLFTVC